MASAAARAVRQRSYKAVTRVKSIEDPDSRGAFLVCCSAEFKLFEGSEEAMEPFDLFVNVPFVTAAATGGEGACGLHFEQEAEAIVGRYLRESL